MRIPNIEKLDIDKIFSESMNEIYSDIISNLLKERHENFILSAWALAIIIFVSFFAGVIW